MIRTKWKIPFDVTNERDVMITLWVLAGKTPIKIATIRSHETMTFEGHDKYAYIATPFKHYSIDKHGDSIEILDRFELNLADYILKRNVSWVVADNGGVSYSGLTSIDFMSSQLLCIARGYYHLLIIMDYHHQTSSWTAQSPSWNATYELSSLLRFF